MRRLLGRQNADPPADGNLGVTSSPVAQTYRPNASQDAFYPTDVAVMCLDRSHDGQTVVLGGRHILKTIHFDGLRLKEGVDIRSIITAQSANKINASASSSDQLSIKDVKLAPNSSNGHTVFTACASGKIFMYDISRFGLGAGLEPIQTREDSRQVNKLDFNPHRGNWLLSGGQDGTVRCFDVKAPTASRTGPTFRTFQAFRCNADGISDVKWSPKDGMMFACATDSGVVLKWDIRKHTAPLFKINAHDTQKGAKSISWHPDGDHLISAGLDSKCYVWDMSANAGKRQKPKWTINTPAPAVSVAWRPGLWSATSQGRRAAQVAVAYDEGGHQKKKGISAVHIWDLARPTMPYKEIDIFESAPSALLWHDQDLLWTGGPDGFAQCDVAFAPKVIDRQPLSNLAFSARGDALMFLEERVQSSRPRPAIMAHQGLPPSPYGSSPTGQVLSISRSDSEEDVIGSFLGTKRRTADKRRANSRAAHTLSTTPPSGPSAEDQVIPLDQSMKATGIFKPHQIMAIGQIPAAPKTYIYNYLSRQYLEILERRLPYDEDAKPLNERVTDIMERYARASEAVSQFRLAQTWRILSYAIGLLLSRRSQFHLEQRLVRREQPLLAADKGTADASLTFSKADTSPRLKTSGEDTPRKSPSVTSPEVRHPHAKSLLAEEIDSESNVPTPLAGPVKENRSDCREHVGGKMLTPVIEMESFNLPPAVFPDGASPRKRLDSTSHSTVSQDTQKSSTEGYDFYDVEAVEHIPKAIDVPRKHEPLVLDSAEPGSPNARRRPIPRHDSEESYTQMFSLSDASRQTSVLTSSSGGSAARIARKIEQDNGGSGEMEEEYASRIRGKLIVESPDDRRYSTRHPMERQDSDTLTDDFKISQATTDTMESDSPEQTYGNSFLTHPARELALPTRSFPEGHTTEQPEDHTSPHITETDFLPWTDDPPYPHPIAAEIGEKVPIAAINPYDILSRALAFESRHSALNASAMILLLKPLVPDDVVDSYQAAAILRQHHSRLMSLKLFVEAALLRNLCVRGWPDGLDGWGEHYNAVFSPAQDRVSAAFTCSQCHKPREIDRSKTGPGIWKCERCRAVMAPCAVCGHRNASADPLPVVPVSEGFATISSPPFEEPILSTWWYCPGCSHGGHANCLQDWHGPIAPKEVPSAPVSPIFPIDSPFPETNSDGCCPFDGCGHACLPGKWRDESSAARTEELGRAVREQTRGSISNVATGLKRGAKERKGSSATTMSMPATPTSTIRGDAIEVPQSKAVESVREALSVADVGSAGTGSGGSGGNNSGGLLSSILSSSPGRAASMVVGSGPERRKSVKFAASAGDRR